MDNKILENVQIFKNKISYYFLLLKPRDITNKPDLKEKKLWTLIQLDRSTLQRHQACPTISLAILIKNL